MDIPDEQQFPPALRWFGRLFLDSLAARNRRLRVNEERARLPVIESAIATLREELAKARQRGLDHVERIYNIGLYVFLVDRDFSVLKVDMVSTFDKWRLRFTTRQMAVLLYEACDDLTQMLGQAFRTSLTPLEIGVDEQQALKRISKRLNQFKGEHQEFLYHEIRNVQGAHRAQDALDFLQAVEGLDPMRVFRAAAEFFEEVVHPLTAFLIRTTVHFGAPRIILKQLLQSKKFMESLEGPPSGGDAAGEQAVGRQQVRDE